METCRGLNGSGRTEPRTERSGRPALDSTTRVVRSEAGRHGGGVGGSRTVAEECTGGRPMVTASRHGILTLHFSAINHDGERCQV